MEPDARNTVPRFTPGKESSRVDWRNWKRSFEIYIRTKGNLTEQQKKDLLLSMGGQSLQNTYFLLPGAIEEPEPEYEQPYLKCIQLLDEFYLPRLNRQHEAFLLQSIKQEHGEKFDDFIQRIRAQVDKCDLPQDTAQLLTILQVLSGISSNETRRKLLERERTIEEVIEIGRSDEILRANMRQYSSEHSETYKDRAVNRIVQPSTSRAFVTKRPSGRCFSCGRTDHWAKDAACPALNYRCANCAKIGHHESMCMQKKRKFEPSTQQPSGPFKRIKNVVLANEPSQSEENPKSEENVKNFVFYLRNKGKLRFSVGSCEMDLRVDSGSDVTLLCGRSWNAMKDKLKYWDLKSTTSSCFGYEEGQPPIEILHTFRTKIKFKDRETEEKIYVAPNGNDDIIGFKAATDLKVLYVGDIEEVNVNRVKNAQKFPKIENYVVKLEIDHSVKPIQQNYRKIPIPLEEKVEEKISELLEMDVIEIVNHPPTWISPIVPIIKDNGDLRLCVDMRCANKAVKKGFYIFPNIEDLIFSIKKPAKLSKMDISNAYYLFELDTESRDITSFAVKSGNYRFKRLMFGIKSAPEEFSRGMDMIFKGCKGVVRYMDDILVFGETQHEHDENLTKVREIITKYGIPLNEEKSEFDKEEVEFLGYMISKNGIRQTDERIRAIRGIQPPKSKEELQSLLGLISYVSRFIPHLASWVEPLRRLTDKDRNFVWNDTHQTILNDVKEWMSKSEYLGYFDYKDRTRLMTDASPVGLGAILFQFDKEGRPRIIAYASKALSPCEMKYYQTEREALGIVWAVEKFQHYLLGLKFEIITDCQALEDLYKPKKKPCLRIDRWILRLQAFDYTVIHKPGKSNLADSLSRLALIPDENDKFHDLEEANLIMFVKEVGPRAIPLSEIERLSAEDEEIKRVKEALTNDNWTGISPKFEKIKSELCQVGELLLRDSRIVIPKAIQENITRLAHTGHIRINSMKSRMRQKVWFPDMDKMIEKIANSCLGCLMTSKQDPPDPLTVRPMPDGPWQDIAIDFKEALPNGNSLLVAIDYHSRYVQIEELSKTETSDTISALKRMFAFAGIPHSIMADNGPQFASKEFKDFCMQQNISLKFSAPLYPAMNGEVERFNRNIKTRLQISKINDTNWRDDLADYILAYNTTIHSTTGVTPAKLFFGRELRDQLPELNNRVQNLEYEDIIDHDTLMKEKRKEYADQRRNAKPHSIEEGDKVLMKNQNKTSALTPNFGSEKFNVVEKNGTIVTIESENEKRRYRRHASHLKKIPEESNAKIFEEKGDDMVKVQGEQPTEEPTRRSKRVPKKPNYLYDFIE